ncbi:phosphatidylglycerol lysyltransferase domain-containing protein [Paracoccaceae bacterium GXU_MW_L88]
MAPEDAAFQTDALDGLRPLTAEDQPRIAEAVAAAEVTGWSYFFPYMLFFSQLSGNEHALFEDAEGAMLVYRMNRRKGREMLSLLVPPFPFSPAALAHAEARMAAFNEGGALRINRVPEEAAWMVGNEGFELRFNSDEYVYDREAVLPMAGKAFATLRRKVRYFDEAGAVVRPYTPEDREPCETLLEEWRALLKERGVKLGPYRSYARNCLANASGLGPEVIRGEVIEMDGKIAAFTFGGPIDPETTALFITISDHAFPGLAYYQRYKFIESTTHGRFFNDFADSGREGLAQMKRSFRPVKMHALLSARRQ